MKQKRPHGQPPRQSGPEFIQTQYPAPPGQSGQSGQPPLAAKTRHTPADRLLRIERRKARNRAVALSIFVLAIMLVTVLLIITVMQQAKPKPRLLFIQEGDLVHSIQSSGLIIRDEFTFNAPSAGLLKPLATEGSRASKGQKLALVIPADRENQLKDLQKCEKDIVELQAELMNSGKGAGAQAIFDESAASLAAIVNLVRGDIAKGDLSNLGSYAASLGVILEQRTSRLMAVDFKDSRLDSLMQTKAGLEASLGLASGTLVCQKPGIVSFKLDGLETVLNLAAAKTLTAADIQKHLGQTAARTAENRTVTKDQPVLRISAGLSQDLAFLLQNTDPALFKIDDFTSIRIPADGFTIENCRVIRSEKAGTAALVIFKTDRKVEWLADRRTVQAELTLSNTSGLKVPLTALTGHDTAAGTASLMLVSGGYTRSCKVKVVDTDRESAIIKAIEGEAFQPKVSAIIIANPESIKAGEYIGN